MCSTYSPINLPAFLSWLYCCFVGYTFCTDRRLFIWLEILRLIFQTFDLSFDGSSATTTPSSYFITVSIPFLFFVRRNSSCLVVLFWLIRPAVRRCLFLSVIRLLLFHSVDLLWRWAKANQVRSTDIWLFHSVLWFRSFPRTKNILWLSFVVLWLLFHLVSVF